MVPAAIRAKVADAIWAATKSLEREAEQQTSAACADRRDRLVEQMSVLAREIAP
jgi:hypothetical protein